MYAVIQTGGKQYRVQPGDILDIERMPLSEDQEEVIFDRVLMVGGEGAPKIGAPVIEGAQVTARLLAEIRGPKLIIFKRKRRKGYRRKNGHRQELLRVRIGDIQA